MKKCAPLSIAVLGGVAAIFVEPGVVKAQLAGIVITVVLALGSGFISGFTIRTLSSKEIIYEDSDEFANAQG